MFLVNGTAWYKVIKSAKKEYLGNSMDSKLVPKTQLQMEHISINDGLESLLLTLWNHLGRAVSRNVLGVRPPENQKLTIEISS